MLKRLILFFTLIYGNYCLKWVFNYCVLNCAEDQKHPFCEVKECAEEKCDSLPPDLDWRKEMLIRHNFYRDRIAGGFDLRGGNSAAANMRVLSYDLELELLASCWILKYASKRPICLSTKVYYYVGYNTWSSNITDPTLISNIQLIVGSWFESITNCTGEIIDSYPVQYVGMHAIYSPFTQLVWSSTSRIGCARCRTSKKFIVLCLYGESGNFYRERVYQRGRPASACSPPLKKNSIYDSLCGEITEINMSFTGLMSLDLADCQTKNVLNDIIFTLSILIIIILL